MLAIDGFLWFVVLPLTLICCAVMLVTACWAWRNKPIVSKEANGYKVRRDIRKEGGHQDQDK